MQTIYAIHQPDAEKLTGVYLEMLELGAPTIRVVDCGDHYEALEGSHRLAAAAAMGLMPTLIVYAQDDMIDVTDYDWYKNGTKHWPETTCEAGYVAGVIHSSQSVSYSFDPHPPQTPATESPLTPELGPRFRRKRRALNNLLANRSTR